MKPAVALSESLEDYLETILHLMEEQGVARSKDIAARMDVTTPSVTTAMHALAEKALVNYEPYGLVTLTAQGKQAAADVARRHKVLLDFFVGVLGADEHEAEEAACRMEHALPEGLRERFACFAEGQVAGAGQRREAGGETGEQEEPGRASRGRQGDPLSEIAAGRTVKLADVDAGRELTARLASMGMVRGTTIRVMRRNQRGPLIVSVNGCRVVLGRAVTDRMLVTDARTAGAKP